MKKYLSKTFNYKQNFKKIDFRKHPELYQVGIGEQGVLMVQPYKDEILPLWKFRTPDIAKNSATKIYSLFLHYKKVKDFVGMDMARKFLQMGFTRSRRYANHPTGRKYRNNPQVEETKQKMEQARKNIISQVKDWAMNEKAESAKIFYGYYLKAKEDATYAVMKKSHKEKYG